MLSLIDDSISGGYWKCCGFFTPKHIKQEYPLLYLKKGGFCYDS